MKRLLIRLIKHIIFGVICTFVFSGLTIYYLKPKVALLDNIHPHWQVIWFGVLMLCCVISFLIATAITRVVIMRSNKKAEGDGKQKRFSKIVLGVGGAVATIGSVFINNHLGIDGIAVFNIIFFIIIMSLSYFAFILYLKGKDIENNSTKA